MTKFIIITLFLQVDRVVAFVRHPQYLYLVKSTFGDECEALVEELIKAGCETASILLCRTAKVRNSSKQAARQPPSSSVVQLR